MVGVWFLQRTRLLTSKGWFIKLFNSTLTHKTLHIDKHLINCALPLNRFPYHDNGNGCYYLSYDPNHEKKTAIVGMFVLRRAHGSWIVDDENIASSMYMPSDWIYNFQGLDGGGFLSNNNVVDSYRLCIQYGLSDAVIVGSFADIISIFAPIQQGEFVCFNSCTFVKSAISLQPNVLKILGSNTVCTEGCDNDDQDGYIWQPYGPAAWTHLRVADSDLLTKVEQQRLEWQTMGYLSNRKYPAQIIVTSSGKKYPGSKFDFLDAKIFSAVHPKEGCSLEVYIITSLIGASRIRERVFSNIQYLHLRDRIDDILITVPVSDDSEEIDISKIPRLLFSQFDMKIVNHDGGAKTLKDFCNAGALSQINITLCRGPSVKTIIEHHSPHLSDSIRMEALEEFNQRIEYFFNDAFIPPQLKPMCILTDEKKEVAIVSFDTRIEKI